MLQMSLILPEGRHSTHTVTDFIFLADDCIFHLSVVLKTDTDRITHGRTNWYFCMHSAHDIYKISRNVEVLSCSLFCL